jgi:L-lactate dehydrogenase complex protein LldF
MTDLFHSQIRAALDDPVLQSALDGNAERRQRAFSQAFASLPQGRQALRQRAHAVRAEVIAHLDQYLAQFIANLQANGVVVHHGDTADQVVQIVSDIAQNAGARLVVKSKSMVSEEVHLNHALEALGVRVVETDLGEYIVQLRSEPPAHIITPAVHLTRAQVAQTFVEKLGIAYTEDIPTLTRIARQLLRQVFLDADIGISGVNFGVAESGTLCIVTNEGNGRMCTTLPRLHIALMGIERLVPTLDDLALMLYLLPRSATGQKLSVYTSLIHSPRRPGEVDGSLERHLILVDNGRSAMRRSPLAESLYCIRCGACLNACPVFREIGGHVYQGVSGQYTPYPGPIGSVVSPGLFGVEEFGHLARASSLCGACKDACPVDIDLPKLLLRVRAEGANLAHASSSASRRSHVPASLRLALRLYTWLASSPRRYAVAQRIGGGFGWLASLFSRWLRLPAFTGWGYSKDFPLPNGRPFRDRFAALHPANHADGNSETLPPPAESPHSSNSKPLAQQFSDELAALGGVVVHCSPEELAGRIAQELMRREIRRVQTWDESHLPAGLISALRESGVQTQREPDPQIRAGLTGALAGVAESGTLVLSGGAQQPLTASLLPEIHLAVLREADILPSLPQALGLQSVREAPTAVLISGPSRTADIEMTLTIGVHGPGELLVYICG